MIETSSLMLLFSFAAIFYLSNRKETYLANVQWVICATRLMRDNLEQSGQISKAEHAGDIASALSSGCGAISLGINIGAQLRESAKKASMRASHDEYLNSIGVTSGALNYLPTKNALYWLGRKMDK